MSNEEFTPNMERENGRGRKNPFLLGLVIFLVLTNIVSLTYVVLREKEGDEKVNMTTDNKQNLDNDKVVETTSSTDTEITDPEEEKTNLAEGDLDVAWNEWPVVVKSWELFDYQKTKETFDKYAEELRGSNISDYEAFVGSFNILKTGKIKNGTYEGKELYNVTFRPEGPTFRDTFFRVIKNDSELILLNKHSDKPWGVYAGIFTENDKLVLTNIEPPEEISLPNSDIKLIKENNEPMLQLNEIANAKYLFESKGNKFYRDEDRGCIITSANDGTIRDYYYDLNFIQTKEEDGLSVKTPRHFDITWLDGEENMNDYSIQKIGGCGMVGCYSFADYIKSDDQLIKSGETGTGDAIYELKDKSMKKTETDTRTILRELYDISHYGKETDEFDDFADNHPLIYWQDPFGNYLEFRNAEYQPMVECGKPVIYLYPEEELNARVYVQPNNGFTITEPAYDNGWYVHAKPNGELYNYADKKTYPYLFWEGHTNGYTRPNKGFVVAKENINNFLVEKLSALGLVKNEYNEFIEFWLPKMQEKPYYFVSFMDQADFEKIAPLTVVPKPDTVIRVFMDYEGLDNYVKVDEPTIKTPERLGFTVVEWGGALHK